MKQLLAASALALSVLATGQQSASAWCNFKFGVGLNLECQSGNNNLLWGVYRSGQVPSPYDGGYGGAPPMFVPGPSDFHAPSPTPLHSSILPQYYSPTPTPAPAPTSVASQPSSYPTATPASYSYPANYYPMNYSGSYYPMNYGYYGNYGYYSFGQ